jgi:hypothetical protein
VTDKEAINQLALMMQDLVCANAGKLGVLSSQILMNQLRDIITAMSPKVCGNCRHADSTLHCHLASSPNGPTHTCWEARETHNVNPR